MRKVESAVDSALQTIKRHPTLFVGARFLPRTTPVQSFQEVLETARDVYEIPAGSVTIVSLRQREGAEDLVAFRDLDGALYEIELRLFQLCFIPEPGVSRYVLMLDR